jgi:hypothetical protein
VERSNTQNRLFEMKTLELLTEVCGYQGLHLGGSRKPDGVIYTDKISDNYGVIIDTKAYSGGYNLPINQADGMQRTFKRTNGVMKKRILTNGGKISEMIFRGFILCSCQGILLGNIKNK